MAWTNCEQIPEEDDGGLYYSTGTGTIRCFAKLWRKFSKIVSFVCFRGADFLHIYVYFPCRKSLLCRSFTTAIDSRRRNSSLISLATIADDTDFAILSPTSQIERLLELGFLLREWQEPMFWRNYPNWMFRKLYIANARKVDGEYLLLIIWIRSKVTM